MSATTGTIPSYMLDGSDVAIAKGAVKATLAIVPPAEPQAVHFVQHYTRARVQSAICGQKIKYQKYRTSNAYKATCAECIAACKEKRFMVVPEPTATVTEPESQTVPVANATEKFSFAVADPEGWEEWQRQGHFNALLSVKLAEDSLKSENQNAKEARAKAGVAVLEFQKRFGDSKEQLQKLAQYLDYNVASLYRWRRVAVGKPATKPAETYSDKYTAARRKSDGFLYVRHSAGGLGHGKVDFQRFNPEEHNLEGFFHAVRPVDNIDKWVKSVNRNNGLNLNANDYELVQVTRTFRVSPVKAVQSA